MTVLNAQAYGESVLMLNVSMPAIVGDYEDAATQFEWQWVISNASFKFKCEFEYEAIINVAMVEDDLDQVPEKLRGVFEHALSREISYVLFYNE